MIGLTMPVIATYYLDKTHQWHTVKAGLRQTAVMYITRGKLHTGKSTILLLNVCFIQYAGLIVLVNRLQSTAGIS